MIKIATALAAIVAGVAALSGAVLIHAVTEARSDPLLRRAAVHLPRWPAGAAPVRVALLSDLHVGTLSTDVGRLKRVVAEVDALAPDLVLIAGDFLPGRAPISGDRAQKLLAPLAALHAPLGVVAVLGNHDHWTAERSLSPVLNRLGLTVLSNSAVVRGPLALGGVDDAFTGHDNPAVVAAQLQSLPGAKVILAHSTELHAVLPQDLTLVLAGHTHCGQVNLAFLGPANPLSRYGRYGCGLVRDPHRVTIVGAGIGTSLLPLRLGAPPDFWLLTLSGSAVEALKTP